MTEAKGLYMDRRAHLRVSHHYTAQFISDPDHPLRLNRALTQDLSVSGVQMLTAFLPDAKRSFDIWIPVDNHEVVKAKATTKWMKVEDTLGDSSYWARIGLSLTFYQASAKKALSSQLGRKMNLEKEAELNINSKVSYIF